MNVKLYKKHSIQSAIALGGKHHYDCICLVYKLILSTHFVHVPPHICYIMICHYCRPIALVTKFLCFIDQTDVKYFFIISFRYLNKYHSLYV